MYRGLSIFRNRALHASPATRRSFCTTAPNESKGEPSTAPHDADSRQPRLRGRSETSYVKRRHDYRKAMREKRQAFLRGEGIGATPPHPEPVAVDSAQPITSDKAQSVGAGETERARRREDRYRAHVERLATVQELKAPRQAAKTAIWEERTRELAECRENEFAAVVAAAETWIAEDTLDQAVEKAVDAFFIAGDAARHANTVRGSGL